MTEPRLTDPLEPAGKGAGVPLSVFIRRRIWACMLPLAVLAVWVAAYGVMTKQVERDREAANVARNFAVAIDQDLKARIGALHLLAVSPLADDEGRREELYREARGFLESFGSHVVFADVGKPMRMLFNTRVPFGSPLPALPRPKGHAAAPAAKETGKPAVGDVFFGPIAREPLVAIAVPVLREGKAVFLMLTIFETRQFQQAVDQVGLPSGWSLALKDGTGEIIAKSGPFESGGETDGAKRFVEHSTVSPWSVVLEIPRALYWAPLRGAAVALGAGIVGAVLIGVLGGMLVGRRLGRTVRALAESPGPGGGPDIAEIAAARRLLEEAAERREAYAAALRESEERYRAIASSTPDHIIVQDAGLRYLLVVNPQLGLNEQDMIGKTDHDFLSPEDADKLTGIKRQVLEAGTPFHLETSLISRDGERGFFDGTYVPKYDPRGRIDGLIGYFRNVTERRRVEEELRVANEELLSVNRLITTTTSASGVQGILEAVLDQALAATGLEGGTICLVASDDTLHLAAQRAASEATIRDLTTNAVKIGDCLCGECARDRKPLILPDRDAVLRFATREAARGEDIRFHAAFPLQAGDTCLGVLCVFTRTDQKPPERSLKLLETVSSQIAFAVEHARLFEETRLHAGVLENKVRQRTEALEENQKALLNLVEDLNEKTEELKMANVRLREMDRLKSVFLATMSHELRTPLNSIIGFTGILLQGLGGPLNEEQTRQLRMVQAGGRHLLNLINDVLDISKIEAGQMEISHEPFDLLESVSKVVDSMAPAADKGGVAIHTHIGGGLGEMIGDGRRTQQILANLIGNAVKFTPNGGGIHIDIEMIRAGQWKEGKGGMVQVSIRDTGIGIRPEDMGRLFQPFQQVDTGTTRRFEGTGLGLSISRRLVELLGGEIRAESDGPGRGSRFTFTLPLAPRA